MNATEQKKIKVALDIGSTKIKVAIGQLDKDAKMEIISIGEAPSEGVVSGNVINIDKTAQSIRQAIKKAADEIDMSIHRVTVGIKGPQIRSSVHRVSLTRSHADEEISLEDVNLLIKDIYRTATQPGAAIVHVAPQDYTVDEHENIKDPIGMGGLRLEGNFQVITAPKNAIANLYRAIKRAGLEIDNLILTPFATNLSILTKEEKEAGVCLIDIGGGTVDVVIYHDNILRHVAVIPFGSQAITQDIRHGCMLMTNQAERLKIRFGKALEEETTCEIVTIPGLRNRPEKKVYTPILSRIIEARLEEIIQLVHSEIISSGYYNQLTAGVVLTGGGAQLQLIEKMFEYIIGYDTRIGYPCEYLVNSDSCPQDTSFSTSIGLLLTQNKNLRYHEKYQLEEGKKELNGGSKQKKEKKRKKGFFSRLLGAFS